MLGSMLNRWRSHHFLGPGKGSGRGTFACVIDDQPRFHLEALRWFGVLTRLANASPSDLVVHLVGDRSEVTAYLEDQGVAVRSIDPFDVRSPHCNKIAGALALAAGGVEGVAVLTDSDVVVCEDPRRLPVSSNSVGCKVVDAANPPLEWIRDIFASAELELPPLVSPDCEPEERTVAGHANGGVYLIPGALLGSLSKSWAYWAKWLIESGALGPHGMFTDQMAMTLALTAEKIRPWPMERRWNFPTHNPSWIGRDSPKPAIVHYHWEVAPTGLLSLTGVPSVDEVLSQANAAITQLWQEAFPNRTFWNWRYRSNPTLGSGVGSRGDSLDRKRKLLAKLVDDIRPCSVLDVGCGDGQATANIALPGYLGIDLSSEAVALAQKLRPAGAFRVGSLGDQKDHADLALCLDVLIHQPNRVAYQDFVERLLASADRALIVSGYEVPPSPSPMIHFHEPLSETIGRLAPGLECYPVREEHEITTLVVLKPPGDRHPRDYTSDTLNQLVGQHPFVQGLVGLRVCAWETIGFFPVHAPRIWEYPAVADQLLTRLQPGARVLDVGAGVNPLVPYLSRHGLSVETLDPSSTQRMWPPSPDWNEWEFLDYAAVNLAAASWNCSVDQLPFDRVYDAAYSVSVIEHLPADDRRRMLKELSIRLHPEALLIFTVDLVRGSDRLWNRQRGMTVEDDADHGTFATLLSEIRAVGFQVEESEAVRDWGEVPVDIGVVVARRSS